MILAFFLFSYPFFILRIYEVNLERVDPFPNPLKGMTQSELLHIYGTRDVGYVLDELYTKDKHKEFKRTFGILIRGFNLKRLGKWPAILIPFVGMMKNIVFCLIIFVFIDRPFFTIMGLNMLALYWTSV